MKKLPGKQSKSLNNASAKVLQEGLFSNLPSQISNPSGSLLGNIYNLAIGPRTEAAKKEAADKQAAEAAQQAAEAAQQAEQAEKTRVRGVKQTQHDAVITQLKDIINDPSHPDHGSIKNKWIVKTHLDNALSDPDNAHLHHAQALLAAGIPNPLMEQAAPGGGKSSFLGVLGQLLSGGTGGKEKGIIGTFGTALKKAGMEAAIKPISVPLLAAVSSTANAQLRRANIENYIKGIGASNPSQ